MKKLFSFLMVVFVLASALWFNTGTASAAGSFLFYIPGVTQQEVRDATIFANSETSDIYCVIKDVETGEVRCEVPAKYAGLAARVFIGDHVFYVTAPEIREDSALTCTPPEVLGAMVRYTYTKSIGSITFFVAGDSLEAVSAQIVLWGPNYEVVSGLVCGIKVES